MTIIFEIKYSALKGEELWIDGDITLRLEHIDGELFRGEYELSEEVCETLNNRALNNRALNNNTTNNKAPNNRALRYSYIVRSGGNIIRQEESGVEHTLLYSDNIERCYRRDFWSWEPQSRPLNSSLFTDAVFRRENPVTLTVEPQRTIIECRVPSIKPDQVLAVVGVSKELGHWDCSNALVMSDGEFPIWRAALPLVKVHTDYKYVILDRESGEVVAWEEGENRIIEPRQVSGESSISLVSDLPPHFDVEPWRGRGVSIPIFSLRTERSMGVGDFGDIRNMVDWAVDRGMSVIQILPINDTTMGGTWEDSYPYNANSTIALHPQYLALREVAMIEDKTTRESFERRVAEIDALPQIDYTAVSALKMEYLRIVFDQQFTSLKRKRCYTSFFKANSWWLEPYALFSVLRDRYSTPVFAEWGSDATYSDRLLKKYKKGDTLKEMEFFYFVQYHLHTQLLAATDYARKRGVALKGDIPIGISRTSVDAWIYPELFNMSSQAGAPPDPFSDLGQNWGFPTYNWGRMAEDGFAWWRARFEKMADYFDAYRIDHILGFFRIWEIPMESIHGLTGRFNPSLPLSLEEIERAGFTLTEAHLKPRISDFTLSKIFGKDIDTQKLKADYFNESRVGTFEFKPEYDTQRKISAAVTDTAIKEGLMLLHNEVLFIEDRELSGHYHPRILGAKSLSYRELTEWGQQSFDRLHDDFYYRRHNDFWRDSAMRKLPTLTGSTNMLVCGEDLGMIPDCVEEVMQREQILSLEIERMPKATGVAFANPTDYPYLSVCTCSTHDMTTIRGWWREDRAVTQRYFNEALGLEGEAPAECSGEIAQRIIDRHLNSPSMLTILPWQDWMAADEELRNPNVDAERINVPANSRHYWRYRMHIKI
ncbi:MAG: 4-alpha-glucanotransferase [Rikenellaceae bacterium]